jgi:hypothetical protein
LKTVDIPVHQVRQGEAVQGSQQVCLPVRPVFLVDQIDYVEEAPPFAVFYCLTGDGYHQVGLAGTGPSDKDDVVLVERNCP